jgi:predicted PurR-regulated permease PerM
MEGLMTPRVRFSSFYRRTFVIATAVALGYALLKILDPFWGALAWASFLAFMLHPLHERLTRKLNNRPGFSAGIITGLTPFLIVAPLAVIGVIFAQQVGNLIEYLRGRTFMPFPTLMSTIERWPIIGSAARWMRDNVAVTAEQIQGWVANGVQTVLRAAAAASGNVVVAFFGTLLGFFLMLFLLFFLLRDGRAMLRHLIRLIPLQPDSREELTQHLASVIKAVVYGTVVTALVQGFLVGVGFAIAGLPSPVVFGVLAAIAAFIPSAGTGIVLIPAVIYLAATGRWGAAIFMGIWTAIVGASDNVLRPILAARQAPVSTMAVFVGVIGGVTAFGFIGFIIGPVLLSLVVALIQIAEGTFNKNSAEPNSK